MINKTETAPVIEPLLVDVKTAAKMLSVSVRTIRYMTESGELSAVNIGKRVLYSREVLNDFVQQHAGAIGPRPVYFNMPIRLLGVKNLTE